MRYKMIDTMRGLACLGMMTYHFEFVRYFLVEDINSWLFSPAGVFLGQAVRIIFLMLVGVSTYVIYKKYTDAKGFQSKQASRFLKVAVAALIVTFVTYIFVPEGTVWLGILHLISLSIVVLTLTARLPYWINILQGACLVFGARHILYYLAYLNLPRVMQVLLGNPGYNFFSLDYFPVVPWLGVPLIGFGLGKWVVHLSSIVPDVEVPIVSLIGKKALAFYLLHWPFIIGFWLLWLYLL